MKSFLRDKHGNVSVALLCIVLIPLTFVAWLVTWTPVAMMIDVIADMTAGNPMAARILSLANVSVAALLIGEIVVYLVWWLASAFRKEDQTYGGGTFEY